MSCFGELFRGRNGLQQKSCIVDEIISKTEAGELEWVAKGYTDEEGFGGTRFDAELNGQILHLNPSRSLPYPFGHIVVNFRSLEEVWCRLNRAQRKKFEELIKTERADKLKEMFPKSF